MSLVQQVIQVPPAKEAIQVHAVRLAYPAKMVFPALPVFPANPVHQANKAVLVVQVKQAK